MERDILREWMFVLIRVGDALGKPFVTLSPSHNNNEKKSQLWKDDFQMSRNVGRLVGRLRPAWPGVGLKGSPIISLSCPKNSHPVLIKKVSHFTLAKKSYRIFGQFKKNCSQKHSKWAKSGHTGCDVISHFLFIASAMSGRKQKWKF